MRELSEANFLREFCQGCELFNKENIVFKDGIGVQGLRFKLHGNHGNYHCNHGNHHGLVSRD